ncbi:MAG: pilus assembly protein PilM [Candidatus Eisenbacteria bacterium]|nr:pilus assembly protein PilM [Candidatus Eisenbacteria bacterium]
MFGGLGNAVVGLDVGSTSVKAVRLSHGRGGTRLLGAAVEEIKPAGTSGNGAAAAKLAAVKAALAGCGLEHPEGVPVVTAVSGPGVSIKHVSFPSMPKQELAESIRWEARRHVPFGAAEFILDFQVLDGASKAGDDEAQMRVLLTAVERTLVDEHVAFLSSVGLEVDTVDLVPLAILNEADEEGLLGEQAVAVGDLGETALNLGIYKRGGLLFARTVPLIAGSGGKAPAKPWLETAVQEARRSLTFYHNESGRETIGRIYLSGGRSLCKDVAGAFQQATGIETALLDPLAKLASAGQDVAPLRPQGARFALAAGLARRRS